MTSEELWLLRLAIGSAAVVVIAVLFGFVIAALQRIDRNAAAPRGAKQIAQNTVTLWALDQTNRDLVAIRDAARGAERGRVGIAAAAPLTAVADKVQGWVASEQHDDKSS